MLIYKTIKILLIPVIALIPLFTHAYSSDNIVIHEIQISGETTKDEYIKLFNPTNKSINLENWRLSKKTKSNNQYNILTAFPKIIIPPNGYLTIAHNNYTDKTDLYYSTSQSLANNNTLLLYNNSSSTIVDLVGWGEATTYEGLGATINPEKNEIIIRTSDIDNNIIDFQIINNQTSKTEEETIVIETPKKNTIIQKQTEQISVDSIENSTQPKNTKSKYSTSGKIIISELLPNPDGSDIHNEWIEIQNKDNKIINISNWVLSDNNTKYIFPNQTLISPNEYIVIPRDNSKITLNNSDTEIITLLDPLHYTIDQVSYFGPAPNAQSWSKSNTNKWVWTSLQTPGSKNKSNTLKNTSISQTSKPTNNKTTTQDNYKNDSQELIEIDPKLLADYNYSNIIINEILPNPDGQDEDEEWIELYNLGDTTISLTGFVLGDGSKKIYIIQNREIGPKEYTIIKRTDSKIALNNTDDHLKLWAPNGTLLNRIQYIGSAPSGSSYSRTNINLWDWSSNPTPGKTNGFPEKTKEQKVNKKESDEKNKKSHSTSEVLSIKNIKDIDIGTSVTTQGIVAVVPNIFGKTYFYIVDGVSGIKIYSAKKLFPKMKVGDEIQVTGSISENGNELRIKISQESDIQIQKHNELLEPITIGTYDIDEQLEGSLITTSGEVVSSKGSTIYLDDGNGEVRVYLTTNSEVESRDLQEGKTYQITGLVSETKTGYRLLPRSIEDIKKTTLVGEVAGVSTQNILIKNRKNSSKHPLYILIGILLIAGILFFLNKKFEWINLYK